MTEKAIIEISEKLSSNMSMVEQNIDWNLALSENGGTTSYYDALIGIVEPRFEDKEVSEAFSLMLDEDYDTWKSMVLDSANGLVFESNWKKLIDLFESYGY